MASIEIFSTEDAKRSPLLQDLETKFNPAAKASSKRKAPPPPSNKVDSKGEELQFPDILTNSLSSEQ